MQASASMRGGRLLTSDFSLAIFIDSAVSNLVTLQYIHFCEIEHIPTRIFATFFPDFPSEIFTTSFSNFRYFLRVYALLSSRIFANIVSDFGLRSFRFATFATNFCYFLLRISKLAPRLSLLSSLIFATIFSNFRFFFSNFRYFLVAFSL